MTGPAPGEPAEVPPDATSPHARVPDPVPAPLPAEPFDPVAVGRDAESDRMRAAIVFVLWLGLLALGPLAGLLLRLRR